MAEAKPETSDDDKIVITKDGKLNPGGSAGMLSAHSYLTLVFTLVSIRG